MNINKIKPYDKNAKKHPDKQIRQIANSIKEFGFNQPIVLDNKGVIIVGHGRYEAAKQMGLEEVPTIEVDLTEEQAKAYRLADNKLNESDWEMDKVIDELKGMSDEMVDLTGFDRDLLIEPDDKDDEVPEVPEEPKSKLGDLYELGNHRVLCGDSTKKEDVEMLMDGKKADLLHTDPPYGIDYKGGSKIREEIKNDTIDIYPFYYDVLANALIVCKNGASAYIWHASSETHNAIKAFIDSGWDYKQYIIWNKNNSTFGRQDYHWKHEPAIYGWAKNGSHSWHGDRKQTTVWDVERPSSADSHPTMKPIELCSKGILNSTKSEDIVLDLFLGSGSTLIACEKTNRICYGMELDPKYADTIVERWCRYTGITNIKKNGVDYKWELQEDK
jgi:DNA modification methylase